ncbi:MAG: hypothetical protein KDC23_00710 [Actinobacteria bacterium]|nr:hypothetical protein [Actinomycetota bacterium]
MTSTRYDAPDLSGLDLPTPVTDAYAALQDAVAALKAANVKVAEARRAHAAAPDAYAEALRSAAEAGEDLSSVRNATWRLEEALATAERFQAVQADLVDRRWWALHAALGEAADAVLGQAEAEADAAVKAWERKQAAADKAAADAQAALAQRLDLVRVVATPPHAQTSTRAKLPDLPVAVASEYVSARQRLVAEVQQLVDSGKDRQIVSRLAQTVASEWSTLAGDWRALQRNGVKATETLQRALRKSLTHRGDGPRGSF